MLNPKELLKLAARRAGYSIRKTASQAYGIDIWQDIQRLSKAFDRPIEVVFDVGAHTGSTTRQAKAAFPASTVYAFEPHPATFKQLSSNTRDLPNVKTVPLALSSGTGDGTFFDYRGAGHVNSLNPESRFAKRFALNPSVLHVKTKTLDRFCEEQGIRTINMLKIDTEGHDLEVLRGAEQTLQRRAVDFVYFEFNDLQQKPGTSGGSLIEVGNYLSPLGFHFVATYTDYVLTDGEFFAVANALLAREAAPPSESSARTSGSGS